MKYLIISLVALLTSCSQEAPTPAAPIQPIERPAHGVLSLSVRVDKIEANNDELAKGKTDSWNILHVCELDDQGDSARGREFQIHVSKPDQYPDYQIGDIIPIKIEAREWAEANPILDINQLRVKKR